MSDTAVASNRRLSRILALLLLSAGCGDVPLATEAGRLAAPDARAALSTTGWEITDLGALPGGRTSEAFDVNTLGQVVGRAEVHLGGAIYEERAVRWEAGTVTDLSGPGDDVSLAYAINDAGVAVGWRIRPDGASHAVLWDPAGSRTLLPSLGGTYNRAYDVNDAGDVAGESETASGLRHPVLWRGGVAIDLGTLGGDRGFAAGIDDAGRIVGAAQDAMDRLQGFLWEDGAMTPLVYPDASLTRPYAINDAGVVVGFAYLGGRFFAWRWEAGTFTDLPGLGEAITLATDINGAGQAVGRDWSAYGDSYALLWDDAGTTDLGVPAGTPQWAAANRNNDLGAVVGFATWPDGFTRAALWIGPAPAPEAIVQAMADAVEALTDGGVLRTGAGTALLAKLNAALAALDRDRDNAAVNQLEAFIAQVEAMVASDQLAASTGDALVAGAETAIAGIEGR